MRRAAYCVGGVSILLGYTANLVVITPEKVAQWLFALLPFSISLGVLYTMRRQLAHYLAACRQMPTQ